MEVRDSFFLQVWRAILEDEVCTKSSSSIRISKRKKGGLKVLLEDEVGKKRTRLLWEFNFQKTDSLGPTPDLCADDFTSEMASLDGASAG